MKLCILSCSFALALLLEWTAKTRALAGASSSSEQFDRADTDNAVDEQQLWDEPEFRLERPDIAGFWPSRERKKPEGLLLWPTKNRQNFNNPFWLSKEKRADDIFWASRGKKGTSNQPLWVGRDRSIMYPAKNNMDYRILDYCKAYLLVYKPTEKASLPEDLCLPRKPRQGEDTFWASRGKKRTDAKR